CDSQSRERNVQTFCSGPNCRNERGTIGIKSSRIAAIRDWPVNCLRNGDKSREAPITKEVKGELLSFAQDLSKLWNDSPSLPQHKKRLLRIAVKEIIATSEGATIRLIVHRQGGDHTQMEFPKIRSGRHRYITDEGLVEIVRRLARIEPDARIASILN